MPYVCIFIACIKVCTSARLFTYVNIFVCKCVYVYLCVLKLYACVCVTKVFGVRVCKRIGMRGRECVYVLRFPRCARLCDFHAPASPCFTIATLYFLCTLDNMYASF